jgi:hypothetical protein
MKKKQLLFLFLLFNSLFFNTLAQTPLEDFYRDLEKLTGKKVYTSLTEALKNPNAVIDLNLSNQNLPEIPLEISQLTHLQKLNLSGNQIKKIPAHLSQLKSLKWLDLYNNKINEIAPEFSQLDSLFYLDLGWNKLKSVPSSIFALKNLQYLYLYANQLKTLPNEIGRLQKLESLRLGKGLKFFFGGNNLREIPDSISQLRHLKELHLPDNPLNKLPNSFNNLRSLQWLDIEHNRFTKIPAEIFEMDSLKYLSIWDRGFSKNSKQNLINQRPNIKTNYINDYEGNFWGISLGFQQGKYSIVEANLMRGFKKDILLVGFGAGIEQNLTVKSTGTKLSFWANGITIFSAGLSTIYYFTPQKNSLAIRPELGLGWGMWSLRYGYNILFAKNMTNVNRHLISAQFTIPINPLFSPFK